MKKIITLITGLLNLSFLSLYGQEIQMLETASLEQVYGQTVTSENLKPFNEIDVEFGYVLYEAQIIVPSAGTVLKFENIRDYAVVYLDTALQGTVTDSEKKVDLKTGPGSYTLRVYAENIGRITYGPEILDNSKGLFGKATLNGTEITKWRIVPLKIKEFPLQNLKFKSQSSTLPAFRRGFFDMSIPKTTYINMSGWGMGEVWVNGHYIGSYWEKEKLQSVQVVADILKKKGNDIVIFELKNNLQQTVKLADQPVFN